MKKKIIALIFGLSVAILSTGQVKTDTLYYDKNWKGVESKHFASYFRVIANSENSSFQKQYRDFYITGELQSEGGYISIDRYDDSHSVFDGEWVNYYKSGAIEQKGYRIRGKQEGEYIQYKEDGLILLHAYFRDDKLDGIYTEFSEDGNTCIQVEYKKGEPIHDYYIISNQDGLYSKISILDEQPIYESPSLEEKKVEYRDGEAWLYYNKNGIMLGMTNNKVRDYGKYFQIPIIIANNSMYPIDFDPQKITAFLTDKKGNVRTLKVFTAEEYMKKVRNRQNWTIALFGFAEALSASNAGYSTSTTNSSSSGYSSSQGMISTFGNGGYGYGSYSGNSSYYSNSSSTTRSYDGAAAYQAQVIASNRIASLDSALLAEREVKNEGYLKRTTVYPGENIMGYINIGRKKGVSMAVNIDINGAVYEFPWDISKNN